MELDAMMDFIDKLLREEGVEGLSHLGEWLEGKPPYVIAYALRRCFSAGMDFMSTRQFSADE